MRKPVAALYDKPSGQVVVFCDDGAVFWGAGENGANWTGWNEGTPIPGSEREIKLEGIKRRPFSQRAPEDQQSGQN
jgi:hypothetical protein